MILIDTHAHLTDERLLKNLNNIIEESARENIKYIVSISDSVESFEVNSNICRQFKNIFFTIAVHPHNINNSLIQNLPKIFSRYFNNDKLIAIGELGLDYYYGAETKAEQINLLNAQLSIVEDINLPLVIHSRNSDEDMFGILKNFSISKKILMHCYTGGIEFAKKMLDNFDVYFSFNGIITFKNSQDVRDVFAILPLDKILLETDAPYLTPVPFRGELNKPQFIKYVYKKCAELKNMSIQIFAEKILENFTRFFPVNKISSQY